MPPEVKGRTPRGGLVAVNEPPSFPPERGFGKFGIESAIVWCKDDPCFSSLHLIRHLLLSGRLVGKTI